jgi:branched-chain amino acid transport system ATP-binding protein
MSALELQGVQTRIGRYSVLHDVTFTVPEGGVFVLLGRNGAGKTTTLRSIMGLWTPEAGSIAFRGRELRGMHTSAIARLGIAFVPEDMGIFRGLTVAENMVLATASGRFDKKRLDWVLELFPALGKFWNAPAGGLSGGQKQMLAVARAIIEPRDLILIDEPTKGLAPAIVDAMAEAFREISERTTILLVEQNFDFARSLGRDMAVIEDGRIVHRGTMAAFAGDRALQTRLLSLSA